MDADIIVVGAGLVGTSFVAALDPTIKVIILEQHLPDFSTTTKDRPLSLAYGSQQILQRWGVWNQVATDACPINTVHVSEQGRFGVAHFSAQQQRVAALGYVVSYNALHKALYDNVCQKPQVSIVQTQHIDQLVCDREAATVQLRTASGEQALSASLLVAADGQHSRCRELMGISAKKDNIGGTAFIVELTLSQPHEHVAYERFTQWGAMAVLPLFVHDRVRLVWTCSEQDWQEIQSWSDATLLSNIQSVFSGRLAITGCEKGHHFALQTVLAQQQYLERFLLLGNAAHSIFPIAAQGFNLSLRDVKAISGLVNDACQEQQNIGSLELLQQYTDLRYQDQQRIAAITKKSVDVFALKAPGFGLLRGMGLLGLDMLSSVKGRLAKRLMGLL